MTKPFDLPPNTPPEQIAGFLDQQALSAVDSEGPALGVRSAGPSAGTPAPLSPEGQVLLESVQPRRRRLPERRELIRLKIAVDGVDYYVDLGRGVDGQIAEVFLSSKPGVDGDQALMQDAAAVISLAMQYGVPTEAMMKVVGRQDGDKQAGRFASIIGEALAQAHQYDQQPPTLF